MIERPTYDSEFQHMHTPRTEINVQAGVTDVSATAFIHGPADVIRHAPRAVVQRRGWKPDVSLGRDVRKIDNDEMAHLLTDQAPGRLVDVAVVIGPSGPLTQMPLPVFEVVAANGSKQLGVEFLKAPVAWLLRTSPQEHRHPCAPPLELSIMEQDRALQSRHRHRRSPSLGGSECRRGARLVVVFDEADESLLIAGFSTEMQPDGFGVLMLQAIVEPLVIAEIEALLLQCPFE